MYILYAKLGKTGFVFIVHSVYLSTCLFYIVKLWTFIFWKRWFSCLTAEFVLYTVLLVDLFSWLLYYIRTFCLISLAGHYLDSVACVHIMQRINLIVFNLYAFFNFWAFISGCLDRKIIVYSWSTINAYSLLSHKWWVPLIKFMMEPTIHVRGERREYAFMVLRKYLIIFHLDLVFSITYHSVFITHNSK